jgi:hypothetical protein
MGFFIDYHPIGENELSLMDWKILLPNFVSNTESGILRVNQMTAPKLVTNTIMKLWNDIQLFKLVKLNVLPGDRHS